MPAAKSIFSNGYEVQYENFIEKQPLHVSFDVLAYLQAKGKDGWIVQNIVFDKEESSVNLSSGEKVSLLVGAFLMYRFVPKAG